MGVGPGVARGNSNAAALGRFKPRGGHASLLMTLHLVGLWAVAVAAPLFDLMGDNPNFLAFRRMDGGDIVLFSVVLAFGPPLLLAALVAAVRLVSSQAAKALHLFLVASLAALIALQAAKKLDIGHTSLLIIGPVLAGLAAATLYERAEVVRSFLTALSAAAVLFPILFLFFSPASDLVFARDVGVSTARVPGDTPVVMIVFDEVSTVALMDEDQQIDPRLFPNLASLARDSTWFRHATATTDETSSAIPTLLSGSFPKNLDTPPVLSEYPHNLFTFLGRSYRMQVSEESSDLCPRTACDDLTRGSLTSRVRSLVSDTSLIYLHLIAPPDEEQKLTPVSETLGNFEAETTTVKLSGGQLNRALGRLVGRRPERFLTVVGSIDGELGRTLYFKHSLLPHVPFEYLGSGRRYWKTTDPIPGLYGAPSWDNAYLRRQAYQRHLLQMQFGDFLLGKALQRLRDEGLYERALIVVTSDGGESFLHRGDRNKVTARNVEDIAATPLVVKAPGQKRGRIVDRHVRTMDVLPTIAQLLDAKLPWSVQGRPVWTSSAGVPERVRVVSQVGTPVSISFDQFRRRVRESVARKVRAFGPHAERLLQVEPAPDLVGHRLAAFDISRARGVTARLADSASYANVDRSSGFVPALMTGSVDGTGAPGRRLAFAVNGTVVGVAPTFKLTGSREQQFSILVDENALHDGTNDVDILLIDEAGEGARLERIGGT